MTSTEHVVGWLDDVRRCQGRWRGSTLPLVVMLCFACSADTVDIEGLPCGDGSRCVEGYVCHPETDLCVQPVVVGCDGGAAICPSSVSTGDACPSVGSFVPCVDAATACSAGCRTCGEDSTWGACPAADCTACGGVCTTFYADVDADGLGDLGAPTEACTAPAGTVTNSDDCDDARPHCGLDCTDVDMDDYCGTNDCDDSKEHCDLDCTNADNDDYCAPVDCDDDDPLVFGVSDWFPDCDGDAVFGATAVASCGTPTANCGDGSPPDGGWSETDPGGSADCDDEDAVCAADCTACVATDPTDLVVTLTTAGTINPGMSVEIAIALTGATVDESALISCSATRQAVWGPIDFTGAASLAAVGLTDGDATLAAADATPFDAATCTGQGAYASLPALTSNAAVATTAQIDATGVGELRFEFVAATTAAGSNDALEPRACCGASCVPAGSVSLAPADISGANACTPQQVDLAESDCNLTLELYWHRGDEIVGFDDLTLTGASTVTAPAFSSNTSYTTSFVAAAVGTVDITCTWDGGEPSDTLSVTIE